MNEWSREGTKRQYRQNEIRILKDHWFQQDLREAEMGNQLDKSPQLLNMYNELRFENVITQKNRREIQLYLDRQRKKAEQKAKEFKRRMRQRQIEDLQKNWLEQDMREAEAKAEAEKLLRSLSMAG